MSPLEAARNWVERGFLPIPIPHRQKAPAVEGWQKLRLTDAELPRYFNGASQNIGILLGDQHADIDCDCMEAVAAATQLAPPTGMMFGRESKPASHYIYRAVPTGPCHKYVDPTDKSTVVELRCQKKKGDIGLQTVVPPSIHPSGELVRFEPGKAGQPGEISISVLAESTARIAAAALFAKHWPKEGSRHDTFLALAGNLARAGWKLDDALAFHQAIYRALWGDSVDLAACAGEVTSTFEKHVAGDETTGFQTLVGLMSGRVVNCALDWLRITRGSSAAHVVEWQEIAPFLARQISPLRQEMFPGFLGVMAGAVSRATESPIELSGLLGMAVASAAIAGKVVVSPEPGYQEPTNLFVAVGMESGNRKTAVLQKMVEPFIDWEREEAERLEPERKRMISERKTQEAHVEALRRKAARAGADTSMRAEIVTLEAELVEIPAAAKLWVQDVTPEQLGVVMAEQGERIAVISDEGGIFDLLAGRYTKGVPNLDLFLQAHAGAPVRVDRRSRPSILLRNPALTAAISPQPDVLQSLSNLPSFRGRGLLARFLYGLPPSPLGSRLHRPNPVSTSVQSTYAAGIRRLLNLTAAEVVNGKLVPSKLRLSRGAYSIWKEFQAFIEVLMRDGGKLYNLKDWASKLPGAAARIAGVMHCVCFDPQQSCEIGVELMEHALNLATVLIDHAIAVFDLMQRDPGIEDAQRILRWIRRLEKTQFTVRDCLCAHQGHFKRVNTVYPAIRLLEEHGYIRQAPESKSKGRPSEIYLVNPRWNEEVA